MRGCTASDRPMMKATARHPLGLLRVASAPPLPPPAASCSGCGPRREAMDAASGLPPWHMVTQNAVPDDGIDCLVDGAEKKVTVPSEARSEKAGPVLCCASNAVDCNAGAHPYLYWRRLRKVCRKLPCFPLQVSPSCFLLVSRPRGLLGLGRKHSDCWKQCNSTE